MDEPIEPDDLDAENVAREMDAWAVDLDDVKKPEKPKTSSKKPVKKGTVKKVVKKVMKTVKKVVKTAKKPAKKVAAKKTTTKKPAKTTTKKGPKWMEPFGDDWEPCKHEKNFFRKLCKF